MAIDPSISLQVLHPTFNTPTDAIEKKVRIADMLAQVSQRKAESADFAAKAPLRKLQTANEIQKITEENLIKQSIEHAGSLVDGHFTVDEPKQAEFLSANQVPGLGSAGYLIPKARTQNVARESEYQAGFIAQAAQMKDRLKTVADPIENFLAFPDEKKAAAYKDLRNAIVQWNPDPQAAKELPYEWNPAVVPKLQSVVDRYKLTVTEHDKAVAAKEKRDADHVAAQTRELEARAKTLEDAVKKDTKLDETYRNGHRILRMQRADNSTYEIDAGAAEAAPAKESDNSRETRINEEAYAESIKKPVAELTSTDRLKARQWVERMSPTQKTDHDKRVELAISNPKLYSFIYGHGDDEETRSMRNAILKDVLNQSEDAGKEFDPDRYIQLRQIWQAQGVELPELTDIKRDEKSGAVSFGGVKASTAALPKPKTGADTATDATYQAYRKVYGTHEATLKAMKTDGWK